ncbi:beta/gamma crystallin domain-containing protein 2 isoform X2 [Erinaceus europaeus]|uniref:Beta/gamma crystallin domain-containing protein 2 isoform X2 n=1 Tax=Erinaceus europaeus TaxID=9365 RepID=A0ABM3YKH1_ERIEU|nr:beta/gamma crystallin domain-containing protein 2 isoform X2 [Erinaceus europaeus]
MAERRGSWGARLMRRLVRLKAWRECRGKRSPQEPGGRDRSWGGQSCPDLAQGQGSTSHASLKVQVQSRSEWDLLAGSCGSWFWRQQHSSGAPTAQGLGRLQRPAVGSASDLASYPSLELKNLLVGSAEPAGARYTSCLMPTLAHWEQPPSQTVHVAQKIPLRPEPPNNLEEELPRPVPLPTAARSKGEPASPQPAQPRHERPSTRRTRYHITVTLQGLEQAPREEAKEPKPAQPACHPCGPEESRGWLEPPQRPCPITGYSADTPQEPGLRVPLHLGSTGPELQASWTPGCPHSREPRTPQGRWSVPTMEEAGGPTTQAEARVVSATLTWRQRPPAQEETRHHFHKVSLVSGSRMEASREDLLSHRREEVNGFAAVQEEALTSQDPWDGTSSKNFQSHGPIFSKKYTPPPKEKRVLGRWKEASDQADGHPQDPRTETPGLGISASTELLVPQPGPREPSPHPGVSLLSVSRREERRVMRTVRTTVVMGGQVHRRVNSSVTLGPATVAAESLPRGRNTTRTIRARVVSPELEGSPSRSQALELLSSLVPSEGGSAASRLPRLMAVVPRSPGPGDTTGAVLGQLPETGTSEQKDRSLLTPVGVLEDIRLPHSHNVPAAGTGQGRALGARAQEAPGVQRASSTLQLPLQASQDHVSVPSSPRLQTRSPSLGLVQAPEQQLVAPTHPRTQLTVESRRSWSLPSVKGEELIGSSVATIVPAVRVEVVTDAGQPLYPSSTGSKAVPGPGSLSAPHSPRNKAVQDSGNFPIFSLTQKEVVQAPVVPLLTSSVDKVSPNPAGPSVLEPMGSEPSLAPQVVPDSTEGKTSLELPEQEKEVVVATDPEISPVTLPGVLAASSPKLAMVSQGPEGSHSTKKEAVRATEGSLAPSSNKEETVEGLPASTLPPSEQEKPAQGSSPTKKVVVQGPVVPPTPSYSVDKVSLGPGGSSAPELMGTETSLGPQLVSDSTKVKVPPEPSREEEELSLAADLEIFLDTLRSMEPPEILRTHRLPRAPRSSYLAMYATLPAIEEDQPGPWVLEPSPQEVPTLEEKREEKEQKENEEDEEDEEDEEEEPENPYLSDDEKLQHKQEKVEPSLPWDSHPSKLPQISSSPLEMMKKHVAGAQGHQPELGLEWQAGSKPASRLGGSLLFGGLMHATKEARTVEPLGTKLSALPPHKTPGLRKVPGQLPLLYNERPPAEKTESARPLEGWSPALKTQSKLNTRPGKIVLFSEPGCQGSLREVCEDVADASAWAAVASARVVRGCWLLYEEPEFQGQKLVLTEGDAELGVPGSEWSTQGIGSLRRVVRDYITPQISLYSEEGLKGEQEKLTEALEDAQRLERPLQVASVSVSAGLWLLFSKPFFEGIPSILEPGEYPTSEAWSTSHPSVGSLKPVTLGCPNVEKPGEPKAVVYEAPGFQGQSWEVSRDIYNLQQPEDSQSPHLASVGSLRILGGCWVGYEKEGFRGHQYLLEEGEYTDWSHWGGYDEALISLRVIRTDFGDPAVVLFEAMDFEGHSIEVSEALPDVELKGHGPHTQAIHVLSGVWVAYGEVGFSGEQYVLEKGVYRNCDDWGSGNSALASLQPVLQIQLFSGPDFLGDHISFEDDQASLPISFQPQSCRVHGGSWILFDEKNFEGDQHILSEGEFPTLTAMGCLASTVLGSLQKVPLHFSEASIFLYGLECFEGKEIELNGEVRSLQAEGFNNHVLSVRIKGGCWVLCEHSDFRGRQWLVGSCEITNWLTYSGTQRVGSLYPIKQRRAYFRLWNAALGGFLAVPDHVEDMKAGRVVVSEPQAGGSCIWYYEDGLLKNQMAPTMSLQVIGPPSIGSKVVLWAESRLPRQTWSITESGYICSQMFEGRILDVKGGRGYDRDHAVLWELDKDRVSQIWTVQVL